MTSGIIIEGVSKEELFGMINLLRKEVSELKVQVENNVRKEYTLTELAREKGYCKAQMKKILVAKGIPFDYEGKELIVSREYAGQIKPKKAA